MFVQDWFKHIHSATVDLTDPTYHVSSSTKKTMDDGNVMELSGITSPDPSHYHGVTRSDDLESNNEGPSEPKNFMRTLGGTQYIPPYKNVDCSQRDPYESDGTLCDSNEV